jgi:protocatechuate 3,4-dioxygenase beta subunit
VFVGPAASPAAAAGSPIAAGSCVLTPEQTEGPYYIDVGLVRSDITEGRPGVPLELNLMVQRAGTCQPIADAVVEIWHCDALGEYSGFAAETVQSQGEPPTGPAPKPAGSAPKPGGAPPGGSQEPTNELRFLRGGQATGRDGRVTFSTIYPGWYRGRTVHIHVKVHAGGNEVHTGQLYFDDALSNGIFARVPYSQHPNRDTTNANDGIYAQGGRQSMVDVQQNGSGMVGSMTLTVQA